MNGGRGLGAAAGNAVGGQGVSNVKQLCAYVFARLGEPVSLVQESRAIGHGHCRVRFIASRLIWSAGTRVVPFTFVPVSARVPACQ